MQSDDTLWMMQRIKVEKSASVLVIINVAFVQSASLNGCLSFHRGRRVVALFRLHNQSRWKGFAENWNLPQIRNLWWKGFLERERLLRQHVKRRNGFLICNNQQLILLLRLAREKATVESQTIVAITCLVRSFALCLSYHKTSTQSYAQRKLKNSNRIQIKGICFKRSERDSFSSELVVSPNAFMYGSSWHSAWVYDDCRFSWICCWKF